MFIIQLFNSPGCSLKLQRKLYAGSVEGEKPGDGCANHMATGASKPRWPARGRSHSGRHTTLSLCQS